MGAGDQIVGVVEYSDYPEAANEKPRVGSYTSINPEVVLDLKPDLIIAYSSGNPPAQIELLRASGIPVYHSSPENIPDIIQNIRNLGELTGNRKQGEARADHLQERYQRITQEYAKAKPVSVFVQIWHEPLMTVDNSHFIGEVVKLCGGENLFPSLPRSFTPVSVESVLARKPQTILMMEAHGSANSAEGMLSPTIMKALNGVQLIKMNENLLYRASGRLLDGTEELCGKLNDVRKYYASQSSSSK